MTGPRFVLNQPFRNHPLTVCLRSAAAMCERLLRHVPEPTTTPTAREVRLVVTPICQFVAHLFTYRNRDSIALMKETSELHTKRCTLLCVAYWINHLSVLHRTGVM